MRSKTLIIKSQLLLSFTPLIGAEYWKVFKTMNEHNEAKFVESRISTDITSKWLQYAA